jgi:hypothetical protein
MTFLRTKHLVAIAGIACLLVMGNQAFATEDAIDVVPAATLLLPYFEVDLNNANGVTTLFSVNNASAAPQLAHVTFWTDMSRPTLDFTIYLTGYDVQTFNIGPLFRTGALPLLTGPKPDPPGLPNFDDNAGIFSIKTNDPAITAGESGNCTFPLPTQLPGNFLDFIRAVHTGLPIPAGFTNAGFCAATVGGGIGSNAAGVQDNIARGYLTVDVVSQCSQLVPTDISYYTSGTLKTGPDANTIWGDFFLVNPQENFAQGETLVHIETYENSVEGPAGSVYTFYGRYNPTPYTGVDNREPLATTWGVRYISGGVFTGGTDLLCWRDNGNANSRLPFNCTTKASGDGQPLSQNQVVIFDEEENPVTVPGSPFSPPQQQAGLTICPWESTRTRVDGPRLPTPFDFGWLYLNLNTNVPVASGGNFIGKNGLGVHQAWVGVVMSASGRFSVGFQGMHFDLANDELNVCIGPDGAVTIPPCLF